MDDQPENHPKNGTVKDPLKVFDGIVHAVDEKQPVAKRFIPELKFSAADAPPISPSPSPAIRGSGLACTKIPQLFKLQDTEWETAYQWMQRHRAERGEHCKPGMAGELFCIGFTPSGMGEFVEIRCIRCGATEHITDTENW